MSTLSSSSSSPTLQHVVDGIYDAALDPGAWKDLIGKIADYGQSSFAIFTWREISRRVGPMTLRVETGYTELIDEYFTELVLTDPVQRIQHTTMDVPVLDDDLEPRQQFLQRSPQHIRFFREWNIRDRAHVLVKPGPDNTIAALVLGRGVGEDDFDRRSLHVLTELSPHLRRSTRISMRLHRETERRESLLAALQWIDEGVFFVDAVGRVVFMNPAAEDLVTRGVVSIMRRRLRAPAAVETAHLQNLVRHATLTGEGRATDPGGSVTLHDADGGKCATLSVSPLRMNLQGDLARSTRAVIFVKEHAPHRDLTPEVLQVTFGLTEAEAIVAIELTKGKRLDQIAEQRGVGKETLRTQLQHVFEKTGVNRQAQLIKVLLNTPAGGVPLGSKAPN